jgi:hypothetical protein
MAPAPGSFSGHIGRTVKGSRLLTLLFTVTTFWASTLLFLLEPMFAKMILPLFGGSPAVWNTAMVFFQLVLFLAYIYSHYVARQRHPQSVLIHSVAVFAPCFLLPIGIRCAGNLGAVVSHPAVAVLTIAVTSIGLPFFIVATSAPLLQKWFSHTGHPYAANPYFLYAASNAGSLVGLGLYPCLLEPKLRTSQQTVIWSMGYVVFMLLTITCGLARYICGTSVAPSIATNKGKGPNLTDKLLWAALAFVPASLLYAFTAQLSTDFPPIPLLWVLPLGFYLATFILVFSIRFERFRHVIKVLPTIIVMAMICFLFPNIRAWGAIGVMKLCCFVIIAFAFHAELARRRPTGQHLTEYYLWVSAAGICGGLLNSFVAPVVFTEYWEYPLTLVVAAALLPIIKGVSRRSINLRIIGIALGSISAVGIFLQGKHFPGADLIKLTALIMGSLLCLRVPLKWTAGALLLISVSIGWVAHPHQLYRDRSFFGKYQVTTDPDEKWHILIHGTTIHGLQQVTAAPPKVTPAAYYMPVKAAFEVGLSNNPSANIVVVGLGAGMVARYLGAEQSMTFYEIDPLVEHIANRYFTFLSERAGREKVVLGDARLALINAAPHSYDFIVLDAFSSDAIPAHLLTKEAFRLYREKLTKDGLLLVHITNRYLDLAPVVAASSAQTGRSMLLLNDVPEKAAEASLGRWPSKWVIVLPSDREREFEAHGWKLYTGPSVEWTDDRSSIFSLIKWRRVFGMG